jgi:hypothetical protein
LTTLPSLSPLQIDSAMSYKTHNNMPRNNRPPKKQAAQKEAEPESPSMLSVLSKTTNSCTSSSGSHLVESSLLILDAYEHRLCHGQSVPSSALTDLRRELDRQPSFAGSLDVTLRLLALQEKAQQHEQEKEQQQEAYGGTTTTAAARSSTRNSSSREQQPNQDDLTSLRPATPGPFKKSDPTGIPTSPHSSSTSYQYSTSPSTRRDRHVYSPSSPWSNDSSEERIRRQQRQWLVNDVVEEDEEEEVDEAELARRRSQVRVRRLNSPNSSHYRRQQLGVAQREDSFPVANDYRTTSPNRRTHTSWQQQQQVQFKDQARSVVVPTNVREVEHTRTTTTTTTVRPIPRPSTDTAAPRSGRAAMTPGSPILQGAPNPDYIVQFKDQAQSLLVVTAVQAGGNDEHHDHYEHIPVAIAVPVFDEEEIQGEAHQQPRKTPSQQRRRRRVYQQVMI